MSNLLNDFLAAGLFSRLDGDDERFAKMERAATSVAKVLGEDLSQGIRVLLAALDPNISEEEPGLFLAKEALVAEWKSMRSVYPDPPIALYRAILFEACNQVASDPVPAAVFWLTAADALPLVRLGRAEEALCGAISCWADRAERGAVAKETQQRQQTQHPTVSPHLNIPDVGEPAVPRKTNRGQLKGRVAAATGPQYRNKGLQNANPQWSNTGPPWCWEFADRMHTVLADELDAVSVDIAQRDSQTRQYLRQLSASVEKTLNNSHKAQRDLIERSIQAIDTSRHQRTTKVDVLWWSEAMYSSSKRRSYRDVPVESAAVLMSLDLLNLVTVCPTPASVGYLLSETVSRLPNAGHADKYALSHIVAHLHDQRDQFAGISPVPTTIGGRLSIRDVVMFAVSHLKVDLPALLARAGITSDTDVEWSLPRIAHAIFRQEQAVRLAGAST